MENFLKLKNMEELMRKDLENATADAIIFPEFFLENLMKAGGETKVPNQAFVWLHLMKLNSFVVEITLQDLQKIIGLSANTLKDILISLHDLNIITYCSTKHTRSNRIKIINHGPRVWFTERKQTAVTHG